MRSFSNDPPERRYAPSPPGGERLGAALRRSFSPPERRYAPPPPGGERLGAALRRSFLHLVLAAVLAGCAVTQPKPPQLDLPAATATNAQNALLERWWAAFDDPVLTALIEEAFANNLDLRGALARIEAARAHVLLAQSNLAPSINAARRRVALAPVAEHGAGGRVLHSRLERLQYRHRDVVRARRLGQVSERCARRGQRSRRFAVLPRRPCALPSRPMSPARTSGCGRPMRSWSCSRTRARRARTRSSCSRIASTAASSANTICARPRPSFPPSIADVARARQAIGLLESAIATLTGRSPREVFTPDIARGASIEAATSVPQLPSGLPSGLLERRPDIRRAESELAASDLRIQEARTNYFPSVSLTGAYGTESAALSNLFTPPAAVWSFGMGLLQPLARTEGDRVAGRGG